MNSLVNLKELKEDMAKKDWSICSFVFRYKSIEYIVLVKRFVGLEKRKNEYALVKLHFMKATNLKHELQIEANSKQLIVDAKELREYFEIEYSKNLGDIINQFTTRLGESIPTIIPDKNQTSELEIKSILTSLSHSDSEDPDKIYCTGIRRNPSGQKRSYYNADKTKWLREDLYKKFANDKSISFCYSKDKEQEKNDSDIYRSFSGN